MPTRIERQIVSEVLSTCGVRSNNNDREAAARNVAALLANYGFGQVEPPNGAAVSDTPTVAASDPVSGAYPAGDVYAATSDFFGEGLPSEPAKCPNCNNAMELQNVCENCGHRQQVERS